MTWVAPASTASIQSFVFTEKAYDAAGNIGLSAPVTLKVAATVIPNPTITFTATPATISTGGSAALNWSSTNATSCTASGAWTGTKTSSGTASVTPTSTSVYNLTCVGAATTTASAVATVTVTPPVAGGAVAVSIKNMTSYSQLYIDGSADADIISIMQSGNTITVTANGTSQPFTGPYGDIVIKGNGGNDTLTITNTVTTRVLAYGGDGNDNIAAAGSAKVAMVTISGGTDTLTGNGSTNYWVGMEDVVNATSAENTAGNVHKIASFYQPWTTVTTDPNYIPLTLNSPNIKDPTDTSANTTRVTGGHSLFGTKAVVTDVNQAGIADCYYLSSIASFANTDQAILDRLAVDLGDGTYVVQYTRSGVKSYVRVDADIDFSKMRQGPSGNLWGQVFEKAYAYFRTGANTYASLGGGSPTTVMRDFGFSATSMSVGSIVDSTLFTNISDKITGRKPITSTTPSSGSTLVNWHVYTVISTSNVGGVSYVLVRNPWGSDGTNPVNDGVNDGLIRLTIPQYKSAFSSMSYVN